MKLDIKKVQELETEMLTEISVICEHHDITYFLGYGSVIGAIRHQGPIPWDSDLDILVPINEFERFLAIIREEISDKFYIDYYDTNPKYQALFPRIGLRGYSTKILHIDVFKLIGMPSDVKSQSAVRRKLKLLTNLMKAKQRGKEYYRNSYDHILLAVYRFLLFPISVNKIIHNFESLCLKYPYENSAFLFNANEGYIGKGIIKKDVYGVGIKMNYAGRKIMVPTKHDKYLKHFYGDYMKLPKVEERPTKNVFEISKNL